MVAQEGREVRHDDLLDEVDPVAMDHKDVPLAPLPRSAKELVAFAEELVELVRKVLVEFVFHIAWDEADLVLEGPRWAS